MSKGERLQKIWNSLSEERKERILKRAGELEEDYRQEGNEMLEDLFDMKESTIGNYSVSDEETITFRDKSTPEDIIKLVRNNFDESTTESGNVVNENIKAPEHDSISTLGIIVDKSKAHIPPNSYAKSEFNKYPREEIAVDTFKMSYLHICISLVQIIIILYSIALLCYSLYMYIDIEVL